ncbi:MAG: hypothetical protein WB347_23515 [Terriglobales bacterium]
MTRRQWEIYGAEGIPWEDRDSPEDIAQSLVDDMQGSDQSQKKRVRAIVHNGLKGLPGRHKGSVRKLPPEAIPFWLAGMAPVSIRLKLHIPAEQDRAFKNRLNAAIKRLSDAERLAGKAAQEQARVMTRKASSALRTKSL